jgi:hypothetical protein
MLRRWSVPIAITALATGSLFVAGNAAAAASPTAAHLIRPAAHLIRPAGNHTVPLTAHGGTRNAVGSTNWSGYAANGGTYTSVSASWVEPTGHCSSGNQFSSFWVGLDGFSSSTVEQTGSEVDCSGSTPRYYSWYEMYPAFPVNFSNTVRPGDHFTGSVTFSGTSTFTLKLADTTQGWSHTINATLAGAARSSAEVIVEAPSSTRGVLPLANFGTVSFTSSDVNGSAIGNFNPTEIIMVDNAGRDKDSISNLSGGTSFSATWLRSN